MNTFKIKDCYFVKEQPLKKKFKYIKKFVPVIDFYGVVDTMQLDSHRSNRFVIVKIIKILKSTIKSKPIIFGDNCNNLVIVANIVGDLEEFFYKTDFVKFSTNKNQLEEYIKLLNIYE